MQITVTPKDLIERCLWANYEYYILKNTPQAEVNVIIEKNAPIQISEKDAFVIGLLKVIYTNNLVHKFNQYIKSILEAKSFPHPSSSKKLIGRDSLVESVEKFSKTFPSAYVPDKVWEKEIEKVTAYISELKERIQGLDVVVVQDWACVNADSIRKMLMEHHG